MAFFSLIFSPFPLFAFFPALFSARSPPSFPLRFSPLSPFAFPQASEALSNKENARYVPRPRRELNPAHLTGVQLQPQRARLGVGTPQLARVVLGHLLDALPQGELPRLQRGVVEVV